MQILISFLTWPYFRAVVMKTFIYIIIHLEHEVDFPSISSAAHLHSTLIWGQCREVLFGLKLSVSVRCLC